MRVDPDGFLEWEHKAITLMGMSGIGKTTLANHLPKSDWFHYSGDYRIGTKYLEEPILDNVKKQAMRVGFLRDLLRSDSIFIGSNITVHNLEPISTFLGKIGRADLGGLPVEEFKRRQELHREAEVEAMKDVEAFIRKAREIYGYVHFVNDAGGSICEVGDAEMLECLARNTIIVYIRPDRRMEQTLILRAVESPKPLYYCEPFLDRNLDEYLQLNALDAPEAVEPDKFVRWVFPRLVAHRRPLYQEIADEYGYTIDARDAEKVRSEAEFLALVQAALRRGA